MSRIVDVRGRQIIDSRGNPTVEADVILEDGGKTIEARVDTSARITSVTLVSSTKCICTFCRVVMWPQPREYVSHR